MYPVDNRNIWINNHVNNANSHYDYKRKKLKKVIRDMVYVSTHNLVIKLLVSYNLSNGNLFISHVKHIFS